MSSGVHERIEDLLTHVQQLAEERKINEAVALVMRLEPGDARIEFLGVLNKVVLSYVFHAFDVGLKIPRDLLVRGAYEQVHIRNPVPILNHVLSLMFQLDKTFDNGVAMMKDSVVVHGTVFGYPSVTHSVNTFDDALVIALHLTIQVVRDLTIARTLTHDHDPELETNLHRAIGINNIVVDVLKRWTGYESNEVVGTESIFKDTTFVLNEIERLTPHQLASEVAPYLQALVDFQGVLSQIKGEPVLKPQIYRLIQNSPLGVDMDGVGGAVQSVKEDVIPWRREHAQEMAGLAQARAEAEMLEIRAKTAQMRVETKMGEEEIEQQRIENEHLRLELEEKRIAIERQKLALYEAKIELALSIIRRLSPEMDEKQRAVYLTQLLAPLNMLTESTISIAG